MDENFMDISEYLEYLQIGSHPDNVQELLGEDAYLLEDLEDAICKES